VYYCGVHAGDSNPNTVLGYAYDCFAVASAEVAAIPLGTTPAHINRVHNMPLDIIPAIDHNRQKPMNAPAFFAGKTCDRSSPGGCQNSNNYSFGWVVETFSWNGATGTYNVGGEQVVKTDVGSRKNKWLYNKPCCGPLSIIPQAGNDAILLRAAESHRLSNLFQFGSHLHGVLTSGPCTSGCGEQSTDTNNVAFWFDLDCSKAAACMVSQTAKISGAFNPEFATVGVDAAGSVGIVAASSTASSNLSLLLWTHQTSDRANTVNGPTTIVAGTQPYTCLNDRNFASIANAAGVLTALDPKDGTKLWTTQQWGNDAARCVWNTRIVEYQIANSRGRPARQSQPRREKEP
jgi:outer membrane protein assembly factor BamB